MRKSFAYLLLSIIICIASFTICGCNNANAYSLTVDAENGLLYEPLGKSYKGGETVTVKTNIICDAVIVATINGEPIQYTPISENGTYTHWEFKFTMPNKNSTLVLKTENGFLPPPMGLNNKIAYYNLDYSTGGYLGGFRMNAYIPTLGAWEKIEPMLPSFKSNYDKHFFEENALLVLFGERGTCEDRNIERVDVTLSDYAITATIYAESFEADTGVPTAMAEWVVVLEIENNIAFSNIIVNAVF